MQELLPEKGITRVALKMVALILSLGMDTLMMSTALGFVQTKGKTKIALTFACAEAIMPLCGLQETYQAYLNGFEQEYASLGLRS
ncbi:hypothetical protein JZ785_02845 [Alicyclobacillus curvatus]|nr:hypothetical protein JZ785_02845 [Alicyclobacillus curvatus]